MLDLYDTDYWSDFTVLPGKDFDDILYLWGIFNQTRYYYCVAYVGDHDYMRWYPANVSPVCDGMFCGSRNVTKAEFLQVIINLLAQYLYDDYLVNRDYVSSWLDNIDPWSQEDGYLNEYDRKIIKNQAAICDNELCDIPDGTAFKTYLKYCMYNIRSCDMQAFGEIKQAFWPVAELNILYQQNVIDLDEAHKTDLHLPAKWEKILEALYKIFGIIDCEFDNDYDCDTLDNAGDNCPNQYNPHQTDTDGDGIGDVCDSDIDNDWIMNPIGIVDDNGRINISVATLDMDNCLFEVNPDQEKGINLYVGDACAVLSDKLALSISVDQIKWSAPMTVQISANSKWTLNELVWNFDDGMETTANSSVITHTFENPGIYTISATAQWPYNEAYAKTTIIVWENVGTHHWLQIQPNVVWLIYPWEVRFAAQTAGDIDKITRILWDGTIIDKWPNDSFKKIYAQWWLIQIIAKARKDSELIAASIFNLWLNSSAPWSLLSVDKIRPLLWQEIIFQTKLSHFNLNDVAYITWDLWEWDLVQNKNLNFKYTYNNAWPKAIKQTITLLDGTQLLNLVSIFVQDIDRMTSHNLDMIPSHLRTKRWQHFSLDINTKWDRINEALMLNYTYLPDVLMRTENPSDRPIKSPPYNYLNAGIFSPKTTLYVDDCRVLENQATIVVHGFDACLEALIGGTLGDFQCDMDKDGIPDVCDNDIDGDGVLNLIWVITQESLDCSISSENVDLDLLRKHLNGVCLLDNCPFVINSDQLDINLDFVGDLCEEQINDLLDDNWGDGRVADADSDQDGILDGDDLCPEIPENYNGIQDYDGCPEIWVERNCPPYGTYPGIPEIPIICNFNTICEDEENCSCPDCANYLICNDCNNNNICESWEDCSCWDCHKEQDWCPNGYICDSNIPACICDEKNNPLCVSCGNGTIELELWETCTTCPEDVGACISSCDNWIAEPGENCNNCPEDVPVCGVCGDGVQASDESCLTCPEDFGLCDGCGNGLIDIGEHCLNCPEDVGDCISICDNGDDEAGETCYNCPQDVPICGICGDDIQSSDESCLNCEDDFGECTGKCGDGAWDEWENCQNCPEDVDLCASSCGNGIIDRTLWETCDDGNHVNNDGCNQFCQDEHCNYNWEYDEDLLETCQTCPEDIDVCAAICGNGVKELEEQCDLEDGVPPWQRCDQYCVLQPICDYDNNCEADEDCLCPDCASLQICDLCGNGSCVDPGENCLSCPIDCGPCPPIDCENIICPWPCLSCPCQFVDFSKDLSPGDKVLAELFDYGRTILYNQSNPILVGDYLNF